MLARWRRDEIAFDLDGGLTEDGVWTIVVTAPGVVLKVMADEGRPSPDGRRIVLSRVHIQGARPNEIGAANLRVLGERFCEVTGYDELVVQGAHRTTGANPGRAPDHFRFKRRRPTSAA